MNFERLNLESCHDARGVVVVIDVLRAFSTACYAFARGAGSIVVTDSAEGAFALRERIPGSLIMGEVDGYPVPGFDFSNSPFELSQCNIDGSTLIQRTSAGTQGLVLCRNAGHVLAVSFCNASATISQVQRTGAGTVSLVATGGDEDSACADFLQQRLEGKRPSFPAYVDRIRVSRAAHKFLNPANDDFSTHDLELCLKLDAVDFSMLLENRDDLLVLKRVGGDGTPPVMDSGDDPAALES